MCDLDYIPEHLVGDNLVVNPKFENGELLFFRCSPNNLEHPYNISLIDLSHNRNFNNPDLYKPKDVLWNTNSELNFQSHSDKSIIELSLAILEGNETIDLRFVSLRNPDYYVDVVLKHKPIYCNITHSAFEISFNNELVDWDNWGSTLGVKKGELKGVSKELRNDLRQFLTKMIIAKQLSNDSFDVVS